MTTFGDFEPEDAYDASDSPAVRLFIIRRVLDDLTENDGPRLLDIARVLHNLAVELTGGE